MVFTQGPLSLGESFGHERRIASVAFFSDGDGGTPSNFVQAANLWYDVRDTYIVRFREQRQYVDRISKRLGLGVIAAAHPKARSKCSGQSLAVGWPTKS